MAYRTSKHEQLQEIPSSFEIADGRRRYNYDHFEFEWKSYFRTISEWFNWKGLAGSTQRSPVRIPNGCSLFTKFRKSYLRKMMISAARRLWKTTWLRNLETIPYSNRTHLVLLRRKTEKRSGERNFKKIKGKHQEKILPPTHPTSARVTLIAQNLIRALKTDLRARDKVKGASNPASKSKSTSTFWQELLKEITRKRSSRYLDHVNWEVIVVDDPSRYNAACYLGGKIVVFTGLLKELGSDAEIATVIGHEIAHALARHKAEKRTIGMGLRVLTLGLMSDHLIQKLSSRFLMLPLSRKFELEADYIGLLLMASAGYDPRVAMDVREKSAKRKGDGSHRTKYFSRRTHPTGKERAHFIAQAQEEAMTLYRKNIAPEQSL